MGGSSVNGSRAPNIVVILDQDVVEIDRPPHRAKNVARRDEADGHLVARVRREDF
jgi:hypothetical protein